MSIAALSQFQGKTMKHEIMRAKMVTRKVYPTATISTNDT
jgi:hypothetical protein